MRNEDDTDARFRAEIRRLDVAPVRIELVARRWRRKQIVALAGVLAVTVGLTLALAATLLAGKSAVDPTYQPPFVAHPKISIDLDRYNMTGRRTRLSGYIRRLSISETARIVDASSGDVGREGLVFRGRVAASGYRGRPVRLAWALRRVGSQATLALPTHGVTSLVPSAEKYTRNVVAWIAVPRISGRYTAQVELQELSGRVLDRARGTPFVVLADSYFARYRARNYEAWLPSGPGWRFEARDVPEERSDLRERFVTRVRGPDGIQVLIDTTLGVTGDPASSAASVERQTRAPGYRRLSFRRTTIRSRPAFEWSFEMGRRRTTDIFLFRAGDGFAVLASGPSDEFDKVRELARVIARSIRPRSRGF